MYNSINNVFFKYCFKIRYEKVDSSMLGTVGIYCTVLGIVRFTFCAMGLKFWVAKNTFCFCHAASCRTNFAANMDSGKVPLLFYILHLFFKCFVVKDYFMCGHLMCYNICIKFGHCIRCGENRLRYYMSDNKDEVL